MKKLTITFITMALVSNLLMADEDTAPIKKEGIQYIKMLGKTLKSELVGKMKEDPSGNLAMGFCTTQAMSITNDINSKLPQYATVRRTALKTRNEANLPDETDTNVLKNYESAITNKTFQPTDIKVVDLNDTYRIYKPLLTNAACLKCHGENISKDIQAVITKIYPKDMAVNFKEGDLRGVIVAEIKKDK